MRNCPNFECSKENKEFFPNSGIISQKEADYLFSTYFPSTLKFILEKLKNDFQEKEANFITKSFEDEGYQDFLVFVNFFGILTRWKLFLSFLKEKGFKKKIEEKNKKENLKKIFVAFANYLGRVTSFRALSLTKEDYEKIKKDDTILSTGRLKEKKEKCLEIINNRGIKKLCYNRLYMMEYIDPTLSVHDDSETAVCIASNFLKPTKQVYLMELNLPLIETIGLVVQDVQSDSKDWFLYHSIWFDARKTTTERYCLNEIPFFKERCKRVIVFKNKEETNSYIQDFIVSQQKKKDQYDKEHLKDINSFPQLRKYIK